MKCPCRECIFFIDEEGIGWEDTHNGFHIVYCKDGITMAVSPEDGCQRFEEKYNGYIQ